MRWKGHILFISALAHSQQYAFYSFSRPPQVPRHHLRPSVFSSGSSHSDAPKSKCNLCWIMLIVHTFGALGSCTCVMPRNPRSSFHTWNRICMMTSPFRSVPILHVQRVPSVNSSVSFSRVWITMAPFYPDCRSRSSGMSRRSWWKPKGLNDGPRPTLLTEPRWNISAE